MSDDECPEISLKIWRGDVLIAEVPILCNRENFMEFKGILKKMKKKIKAHKKALKGKK